MGEIDNVYFNKSNEASAAQGGKYGLTGSVGLSLELNNLEPNSAQKLSQSMGISASSLFLEYETTAVNNFDSPGFDFSNTDTDDSFNHWRVGVYFEF